jgi:hypothetical protein
MRQLKIGYLLILLMTFGCTSGDELYKLSFKSSPPKSVKIYHSQEQYFSDCCNWLHLKIDSTDLNKILRNGFKQQENDFSQWQNMAPPEAKEWWHPESLGDTVLYFQRETERYRDIIFTTPNKDEVYHVHYYK